MDSLPAGTPQLEETSLLAPDLRGLVKTARLIHAERDLDKLLLTITQVAVGMLESEGATVVLRDPCGGLVFHSTTGLKSKQLKEFRLEEGEGIAGNCIRTRSSIVVNDVANDPRFSSRADTMSGFKTRSILCTPLVVEDKCIGALEAVNKYSADGFSEHDIMLSEAVSNQVAVAIHNVQLTMRAVRAAKLAAIGEAVAGITHCMKNMLNGLQGSSYMIKRELKKANGDEPNQGLEMLERSLARMRDLVGDMLTYSKDREPEYERTDVNEMVGSVIELMNTKAGEINSSLKFEPDDGLTAAEIDSKAMYRCVLNLVSNALDACEETQGGVTVRTLRNDETGMAIEVRDEGCGMDEKTMKSMFQPFYSSKGSKGTGLGLSVTRKIVSEHGGHIEVESKPGHGSTIRIQLPTIRRKRGKK